MSAGKVELNILTENNEYMYVGLNYYYFHSTKYFSEYTKKFYFIDVKEHRDFLIENYNKERIYIDSTFNQVYLTLIDYPFDEYYKKIKLLFKDKNLVIFCGQGILDGLHYDVFELANSKEFVYGPRMNAYDVYNELLNKAKAYSNEKVLCFILGPTSKILVNELSKLGYCAWDIGHMAKDYDVYMKQLKRTDNNIIQFYAPD